MGTVSGRKEVLALVVVVVGTAGLSLMVAGADFRGGGDDRPAISVSAEASPAQQVSHEPTQVAGEVPEVGVGAAEVDPDAGSLSEELPPATERSTLAAVEAFVASATWVLASPAAESEPSVASDQVSDVLNFADRESLALMNREGGVTFEPAKGAYRVLGFAGSEAKPDSVMIEVVAPLTVGGSTRWTVVGGVVSRSDGEWQLTSIRPRRIAQPKGSGQSLVDMAASDRAIVLDGLGWSFFANAAR